MCSSEMGCSVKKKKHFKSSENRKTLKRIFEALIGAHGTQFKRSEGQHPGERQGHDSRQSFSPGFVSSRIFSQPLLCPNRSHLSGGRDGGSFLFAWFWLSLVEKDKSRVTVQMFFFELITLLGQAFFSPVLSLPPSHGTSCSPKNHTGTTQVGKGTKSTLKERKMGGRTRACDDVRKSCVC